MYQLFDSSKYGQCTDIYSNITKFDTRAELVGSTSEFELFSHNKILEELTNLPHFNQSDHYYTWNLYQNHYYSWSLYCDNSGNT